MEQRETLKITLFFQSFEAVLNLKGLKEGAEEE